MKKNNENHSNFIKSMGAKIIASVLVLGFIVVALVFIFIKKNVVLNEEDYISKLKDINSYVTDMEVTFTNKRMQDSYSGKLTFSRKYGDVLELKSGRKMIFNKKNVKIKDSVSKTEYNRDKEDDFVHNFLFLEDYINLLYTNEEVRFTREKIDSTEYIVINLKIYQGNDNFDSASLWVNKEKVIPEKVVVYNKENLESMVVKYRNFEKDISIDEAIFK